eukprot:COSAG01_NODE_12601_length_1712_cov_13.805332_1_plen_49_part_10
MVLPRAQERLDVALGSARFQVEATRVAPLGTADTAVLEARLRQPHATRP